MARSAAAGRTRRAMLLAVGGLAPFGLAGEPGRAGTRRAAAAATADPPLTATLLLPGPAGSPHLRWAARFAAAAAAGRATPSPRPAARLQLTALGGADGVTAANRFATTAAPDGRTLLALAGAAVHARLVGDSRAHYEPSAWLPICAVPSPTALLIRRAYLDAAGTAAAVPAAPLRLALPAPGAPETAALLALDLLGIRAEPVFGLAGATAEAALAQGRADALLCASPGLVARARAIGAQPWFAVEPPAGTAAPGGGRDPALAGIPGFAERAGAGGGDGAARVAIAAARAGLAAVWLGTTIVLPALTPAERVTRWRQVAARWAEEEQEDAPDPADPQHPLLGAEAATAFAALCAVPEAVVDAYRGWLSRRLNWRAA